MKFNTVKLGDYLYIKGRIGWKGLKKEEYLDISDYRIINGESLTENGINWEKAGYITEDRYIESPEIMLQDDDILISKDGTIGKTGYIKNLEKPTTVASGIFVVRNLQPQIINTRFIYHYLNSKYFKNFIQMRTEGSVIPHLYQKDFIELDLPLPDMKIQDKIVGILDSISTKIDLNKSINKNLQQQARTLYKAWFEDFEPFNGHAPNNWITGKLKDVLQLKRNATKAGQNWELPYLPIDVIPMNTFALSEVKPNEDAKSSLITFDKDDIVIGAMRVYFHRVVLAPFSGITRTTCFTLTPYDDDYLSFGLLCCDQDSTIEYAQTTSKGSTMPYAVWDGGLGDMEITIPDKETAHNFNELVLPMLRHIQVSFSENRNLTDLRDSLLPKLMSGEIDVSDLSI